MATPNSIVPELLTKDNYRKWSICMRHYFVAQDLWDVVDPKGSAKGMRNGPESRIKKEWIKKNALALLAITTFCGEELLDRIESMDSARDAWIALVVDKEVLSVPDSVDEEETGRGEIQEMGPAPADDDASSNNLAHEHPPASGETAPTGNGWKQSLVDMIYKGGYTGSDIKEFFVKHTTAIPSTALHIILNSYNPSWRILPAFYNLIFLIDKIEDLVVKDERGNTLLTNALRVANLGMIEFLIIRNKELLAKQQKEKKSSSSSSCNKEEEDHLHLLLTAIPDANGKIPVQLICEGGDKYLIHLLYKETPWDILHPKSGEYGFYLIKDCISKKMFDIALHLLHQIPELTFYKSSLDGTTILLTMAQFSQSPFSHENQLAFWNRWLYHCINFEVKFKPSKESANEDGGQINNDHEITKIGFDVYTCFLGIRWRNSSVLKAAKQIEADVHNQQQVVQADNKEQEDANSLVDQQQQERLDDDDDEQECDVEANRQVAQHAQAAVEPQEDCYYGVGIKIRNVLNKIVFIILWQVLWYLGFMLAALGLDLLYKLYLVMVISLILPVQKLSSFIGCGKTHNLKLQHVYVNEILNVISKQLKGLGTKDLVQNGAMEATFIAIKNHIPEVVMEFTKANENVLWQFSDLHDPGRNMLATSVINRQEKVAYYLLHLHLTNAINIIDEDGNNMLHLAAKLAPRAKLTHISGAALQLQSELRWFKGVEGIVPSFQKDSKNKKKKTPFELFATEHEDLMREAEEWLKKASESSTVVGALIITIMFTAAFTVPGGNNQDTGLPIFSHKPLFLIFIIADAVSLFAAATSVLMFLGILTSRYALEDFMKSLPMKLILGLSSLFISIAAMMAAFCAALFIILQGQLEVVVPITLLAGIPVISFVLLQFPLLVEILKSTYSSDIFMGKEDSELHKALCEICNFNILRGAWKFFTKFR